MREEISFEVGAKYENMKGVFEVIAIRNGSMDIRWENGEETSTPIALQQRIIERMLHEKELAIAQLTQQAKKSKPSVGRRTKEFSGMEDDDFHQTVTKTSWRGRGQLGGAVARELKNKTFKFNSWAVLREPEVCWLDIKRQKREDLKLQAKFYVRLEDQDLCYGFRIPSPDPSFSGICDWHALMNWLNSAENETWLNKQCASHHICIYDRGHEGFVGTLEAEEDRWKHCLPDNKDRGVDVLSGFLSIAAKSSTLDLRFEKRLKKEAAIESKQDIARDIVVLFEHLMPLYAAAATRDT